MTKKPNISAVDSLNNETEDETKPDLPTHITETDALKWDNFNLKIANLRIQLNTMERERELFFKEMETRYSIGQKDQINLDTRLIQRG